MGVHLNMSTAACPELDGSSEHTNKTLVQAIYYHVNLNQKSWLRQLPQICFAIINTVNASTGYSPFQLKTGRSSQVIPPLTPPNLNAMLAEISACKIIAKIKLNVQDAQDALTAVKVRQAYHANMHHRKEIVYNVNELVMLSTANH